MSDEEKEAKRDALRDMRRAGINYVRLGLPVITKEWGEDCNHETVRVAHRDGFIYKCRHCGKVL